MMQLRTHTLVRSVRLVVTLCVISLSSITSAPTSAGAARFNGAVADKNQPNSAVLREAARGGQGSLTPTLTCVDITSSNQFTAYFGYTNSGGPVNHPTDSKFNRVSPSLYNGSQPSNFSPGTFTNAFSVVVTSPSVSWTLERTTVFASKNSTRCAGSSLPVDPLGLSLVITIGVGIVAGVIFVRRTARRRKTL